MRYKWLFFLLLGVVLHAPQSFAAEAQEARRFVDETGKKVLAAVNGSGTHADKQQQLRQLFEERVDIDWMAQFVLGRNWGQADDSQKARYLQAYREYLLARYTTNFADYTDSNYTITNAKPVADGQFVVGMSVTAPNAEDQEIQAGYRIRTGGHMKIIDIIVEGVSLITTQRSEFASVVQKEGMEKLIERLRAKTSLAQRK